jgi:hypothetical protein
LFSDHLLEEVKEEWILKEIKHLHRQFVGVYYLVPGFGQKWMF